MIDVRKIVDDIGGEGKPEPEPDGDEMDESGSGEDHKAKIQAAMAKINEGMAELQKCVDEY